jgi:plastocyanin
VTFDDGVASPTQSDGTYSRTFAAAGTYTYHCTVHPSMTGTITVQ